MKPTKNHYYCPGCQHQKMKFASRKEALLFMEYNAETIEEETGKKPVRAYYCYLCGGWHLTSKPYSHSRADLMRRFGPELGEKMYNTILPLVIKDNSIIGGLTKKIKVLKHNLRYNVINGTKCRALIDELYDIFEVVINARLEEKSTVDRLFLKFSFLCNIFTGKKLQEATAQ